MACPQRFLQLLLRVIDSGKLTAAGIPLLQDVLEHLFGKNLLLSAQLCNGDLDELVVYAIVENFLRKIVVGN